MTYAQFEEENARAQSAEEKETDDEAATSEEQILQHKKLFLDAVLGHPNVEILNSGIKKVPMLRLSTLGRPIVDNGIFSLWCPTYISGIPVVRKNVVW